MAGEIQEPFNLSLLENSIHSGSVSFGRFEKETLSWEKRSSFSHNRYLEEAEKFTKPGSVTEMRAHFEAHFKKRGIRFPSPIEAQTWGEVIPRQPCTQKDANLWESTSHCSLYSYDEIEKFDQEKSQYGDSCVSYDDEFSYVSVALEKAEIGCSEMTLEDKETTSSSAAKSEPLKTVQKAINHAVASKASTKEQAVMKKSTKTIIDTKREKKERIVKSIASKAPTAKKPESVTPLATNKYRFKNCIDSATREKRTTSNSFSFRSNERAEKRKEEKVETVVCKALHSKAKPIPKSTQLRQRHTSIGQAKAKEDAQEKSSKTGCDQSVANGTAKIKSKLNFNKQKADIQRSLNGLRPKSSHQSRNNAPRRSLMVRRSAVEVAL